MLSLLPLWWLSVEVQDLVTCLRQQSQLQWVVDQQQGDAEVNALATIRLAKVLSAQGQHSQALALLVDGDDAWQLARLETRGDVLVAQRRCGCG